ncbi:evC complex member EVC [Lampris incognitus]|uniref:evC complex member EVC n=1 Tax=Lampris incognitus TaxID=2546036 RepID=UPI0024B5A27C|nr:evC complex member EVC [Lampris incognitus]
MEFVAGGTTGQGCAIDVLVSFAESLHVFTGLLTVATVSGGISGILVATFLYVFCLKPLLLTRQGYNARRLLEPDDGELGNNQSDCVSNGKKEVPPGTMNDKKQPPMNSDVAAFASKAKVVYPINQKYRPLADGASNPSLHEPSKLQAMPNEESSSSSAGESLSQEQDNDDSSQCISSALVPKSLQNQSFTRVSHYPQALTQTGFESRISLYCLGLHDVQQQCSQLQEEKYLIFLQMVKIIFSHHFPKDKNEADFSKDVPLMQEKELDELKKRSSIVQTASEGNEDLSMTGPCTLEETERVQKDHLEHGLQMIKGFSKQVEGLCQHLLNSSSILPTVEAQNIINSLIHTMLLVENNLFKAQEAELKRTQQRLLWWEELMWLLQSQPALLGEEVSLRQGLVAKTLEQLTSDDLLTFTVMEKALSELQAKLTESLQQCTEDCMRKTKELVMEKCKKTESKRKKLQSSQAKEKRSVLDLAQSYSDPQQFTKVYQELLVKHRQQNSDLELQQDNRLSEALCNLWKKLHSFWSKRLGALVKELFLTTLPALSELSSERCEELWLAQEPELAAQLQRTESVTKLQLEGMRAQLDQDEQVWCEEIALVLACLRHLAEQQMKILRVTVAKQSYTLNSQVGMLIEKKHEHLLLGVQRHFITRHFCLHVLKEMRLSKLKVLSQTDLSVQLLEEHNKTQPTVSLTSKALNKDSSTGLPERHLGPESQLVGHNFHQEFLSELETGVELLQNHAQLLIGNAVSHAIWQQMEVQPYKSHNLPQQDSSCKCHLTEVASESVYVTKDNVSALVQNYYSHIKEITRKLQQDLSNINSEEFEKQEASSQLNGALMRELTNWGRKPTSTEFQQRVELHKRKVLEQYDTDQQLMCETLLENKVAWDRAMDNVKGQLQEAEETFITELAALARVPLHCIDPEPSSQEDDAGEEPPSIQNLLALNPALDPAKNPSLTPTYITPAIKPRQKKQRERESQLS